MDGSAFVGRQPIMDRDEHVVAYELLYRASREAVRAEISEVGRAATRVIVNALGSLGLEALLGRSAGFFNVNREVLLSDSIDWLPAERVVIELLEEVTPDDEVFERCQALRARGFRIALDDWIPDDPRERLLGCVDVVKVDLPAVPERALRRLVRELRRRDVELLAEKVETREQFEACHALGFERFQGFYFARPTVVEGADLDATKATLIRLLQLIAAEAETASIVEQLKQDAKLGLHLLRLVNTPGMASSVRFETIEDAVRQLGLERLARWVAVLLYVQDDGSDWPSPLLTSAAHRGRLMELVMDQGGAGADARHDRERAFLVGMLSLADALLRRPLGELVRELHLGDEVACALTERAGMLGALLDLAEQVERSDLEKFEPALARWDLDLGSLQAIEHDAYAWVHGLTAAPAAGDAP